MGSGVGQLKLGALLVAVICFVWTALPASVAQSDDWFSADIAPVTEADLDDALNAFEADDSLQKERPISAPDPEPKPNAHKQRKPNPFFKAIGDFFASLFGAIGPGFGYVMGGLILIALIYGAWLMFGDSLTFQRKDKEKDDGPDISVAPDLRPDADKAAALLGDADALAAQGQFAEAVHMLLFRSITDIQEKLDGGVPKSLTAREIGMLTRLPDSIRRALSPIIAIVERSFFGGRPVDEAGWVEARASYQTFVFGEGWT